MAKVAKAKNRISGNGAGDVVIPERLTITPPNIRVLPLTIRGTTPLVMNAFSPKAMEQMKAVQMEGSKSKRKNKKEPKDFEDCYQQAKHVSHEGWCGIPATAFRNAMISACRVAGFVMTKAKLSVFVEADGYDRSEGSTPLVKITKGEPEYMESIVRYKDTVDIRPRPMWKPGWEAIVRIRFDADQFNAADVLNLMARVGMQVGICEGRPDSKSSAGMGWGLFEIIGDLGKLAKVD